ncbi:unnamed protein product [Caretta caretta]
MGTFQVTSPPAPLRGLSGAEFIPPGAPIHFCTRSVLPCLSVERGPRTGVSHPNRLVLDRDELDPLSVVTPACSVQWGPCVMSGLVPSIAWVHVNLRLNSSAHCQRPRAEWTLETQLPFPPGTPSPDPQPQPLSQDLDLPSALSANQDPVRGDETGPHANISNSSSESSPRDPDRASPRTETGRTTSTRPIASTESST